MLFDQALELGQLPSICGVVELAARFESLVRYMHLRDTDEIGIMFTAPGLPLLLKWACSPWLYLAGLSSLFLYRSIALN